MPCPSDALGEDRLVGHAILWVSSWKVERRENFLKRLYWHQEREDSVLGPMMGRTLVEEE